MYRQEAATTFDRRANYSKHSCESVSFVLDWRPNMRIVRFWRKKLYQNQLRTNPELVVKKNHLSKAGSRGGGKAPIFNTLIMFVHNRDGVNWFSSSLFASVYHCALWGKRGTWVDGCAGWTCIHDTQIELFYAAEGRGCKKRCIVAKHLPHSCNKPSLALPQQNISPTPAIKHLPLQNSYRIPACPARSKSKPASLLMAASPLPYLRRRISAAASPQRNQNKT